MDYYEIFCGGNIPGNGLYIRGFNMNRAKSFNGEISVLDRGYASWWEVPIMELPNEVLIWDSGRII